MRRFSHPRGALLLVVLALLAMFGLVAVALVVLAQRARVVAKIMSHMEQANDPPPQQLDAALRQVLRGDNISPWLGPLATGTACTGSAIGPHSLLETMYGNLCITGSVGSNAGLASTLCGNQMWTLTVGAGALASNAGSAQFTTFPACAMNPTGGGFLASTPLAGRVITMTSGAAAGQSSLIVDANPLYNTSTGAMTGINYEVMAFDNGAVPSGADTFTINGVPFSGAGFGYSTTAATTPGMLALSATTTAGTTANCPVALLPGYPLAYYPVTSGTNAYPPFIPSLTTGYFNPPGGANTDYTAADFQHMLLAAQTPAATGAGIVPTMMTPIPSLHRPELIRYWMTKAGVSNYTQLDPGLLRMIMLRPNAVDHPNFTGSNSNFKADWDVTSGTDSGFFWDVDNDGDGVADSVWVDLGMPVRETADGRHYKPLFAILVVDLDGRLNLNAHGAGPVALTPDDRARFTPTTSGGGYNMSIGTANGGPGSGNLEYPYSTNSSFALASTTGASGYVQTANLPRGVGYGPAEISLLPLFSNSPGNYQFAYYNNLFVGAGTFSSAYALAGGNVSLPGRYGEFSPSGTMTGTPAPGVSYTGGNSFTNTISPLTYNKWWNYSGYYWGYVSGIGAVDAYGAPPDFQGVGAMGLDPTGQPLYMSLGGWLANTPYDIDLSRGAGRALPYNGNNASPNPPGDDPFGAGELELLLRPFDRDSPALPSRLAVLTDTAKLTVAGTSSILLQKRYEATTDSWDVPCPAIALPMSLQTALAVSQTTAGFLASPAQSVLDLLKATLIANSGGALTYVSAGTLAQTLAPQLIAPEMMAGLKLNLNQPTYIWRGALAQYSVPPNVPPTPTGTWDQPAAAQGPDWPAGLSYSSSTGGFTETPATDKLFNFDPGGLCTSGTATLSTAGTNYHSVWSLSGTSSWPPAIQSRQRMARYLYVLLMMLRNVAPAGNLTAPFPYPYTETLSGTQNQELDTRRLAQWSINAVTFATNDSIMVPFKYDPNVLTNVGGSYGWHLLDDSIDPFTADLAAKTTYGVVWGCKPPELVMTEAVAWHNRRVADTWWSAINPKNNRFTKGTGANPAPAVPYLQQTRVPQGSLFVELYCPRAPANQAAPSDLYKLYTSGGTSWRLNLDAATPANPSTNTPPYPVWRIVVGKSNISKVPSSPTISGTVNDLRGRLYNSLGTGKPDSTSMEPEQYDQNGGDTAVRSTLLNPAVNSLTVATNPNIGIDRIMWLSSTATVSLAANYANYIDNKLVYYNQGAAVQLQGGQYLVIGPRPRTVTALNKGALTVQGYTAANVSKQEVDLFSPTGVSCTSNVGGTVNLSNTAAATMIVAGVPGNGVYQNGWTAGDLPYGFGINISEPIYTSSDYYSGAQLWRSASAPKGPNGENEWYGDPTQTAPNPYFPGPPFEVNHNDSGRYNTDFAGASTLTRPLVWDTNNNNSVSGGTINMLQTGTTINYKTLFLQRIANPLMPYNPATNPYLTVDWLPVDLTVYNGDDAHQWNPTFIPDPKQVSLWMNPAGTITPDPTKATYLPWDPDDPMSVSDTSAFSVTYQQGKPVVFASRQRGGNVKNATNFSTSQNTPAYYNLWAQAVANQSATPDTAVIPPRYDPTDPYLNTAGGTSAIAGSSSNFDYDLNSTLGGLNVAFSTGGTIGSGAYAGDAPYPFPWIAWNNRPYANAMELLMVPSSHPGRLMWEFQFLPQGSPTPLPYKPNATTPPTGGVTYNPTGTTSTVPYPYLLNFFQSSAGSASGAAPQLYRILEYVTVPSPFVQTETFVNPNTASAAALHNFHPPFNRISKYREPGKINLNTIYSSDVLYGLLNNFPGLTNDGFAFWNKFVQSRGGPSETSANPFAINSSYPTRFANPFRSFAGGSMVPLSGLGPQKNGGAEIEATLLRSDPTNSNRPLFQWDSSITTNPLSLPAAYDQPDRNPYFRYQALTRLGNLVTTRSNVYAIWITVGYFEVTPWTNAQGVTGPDAGHPDGYQLGAELGSDSGDVERHRAFYIYDRTIPVGFQRGQDLNIEKGLLVRRYIE